MRWATTSLCRVSAPRLDGDLKGIAAYVVRADGAVEQIELYIADMTAEERAIVKAGCLINSQQVQGRCRVTHFIVRPGLSLSRPLARFARAAFGKG